MKNSKNIIELVNVPKLICKNVIGKNHSKTHRRVCGLILMAAGVFIAEVVGGAGNHYAAFACNMIGYGLHGTGLLPFIEIED